MGKEKQLNVLCGLPASGKSTYIENLKLQHPNAVIWSRDYFVEKFAKENGISYSESFVKFSNEIEISYKNFVNNIKFVKPSYIICDKTNLSSKIRDKEFWFFHQNEYYITYTFFTKPITEVEKQVWYSRLDGREGKNIPKQVLNGMYKNYADFVPKDAIIKPDEIVIIDNWNSEKDII